jgi:hypothetical protein
MSENGTFVEGEGILAKRLRSVNSHRPPIIVSF